MTPVSALITTALLACSGKGGGELEPAADASAGLVKVETGLPSAGNAAAQASQRGERDAILAVLKTSQPAAQACYVDAVGRDPHLHGDLVARVDIVADGSVGRATITRTTLRDDGLGPCVAQALEALTFPAPSKDPLVVSYPYVFVSDLTPPEVVRALYIKHGFLDPDDEIPEDDKRKELASGEDGWYEHW